MKGSSLGVKLVISFLLIFTIVSTGLYKINSSVSENNIAKANINAPGNTSQRLQDSRSNKNKKAEKADKDKKSNSKDNKQTEEEQKKKKEQADRQQAAKDNAPGNQAKRAADNAGNNKKGKKKKAVKSYASAIFDNADKNQSIMYYNSQTNSGVDTVESIINKESGKGEGTKYAAFLQSMDKWNLYKVYTNQKDVGVGTLIGSLVKVYSGLLIGCLYIMDGLDYLLKMFADLFNYLNIYKYIADENGVIPKSNPLSALQPILDVLNGLGNLAKIFIAIGLACVLFLVVSGIGPSRNNRSRYFGRGVGKVMLSAISLGLTPLILSSFFSLFSDVLDNQNDVAKNTINDTPSKYIVDTSKWIDNSLSEARDKKNAESVNGGYVLLHDHKGMPKTESDVKNKIPTASFIEYLNTGGKGESPDGKELLARWSNSDTMTADGINSMYGISDDDKEGWGGILGNDEKRAFQFKLAPESNSVKAFGGKDAISLDLNDVSIETATLAGNTAYGQFLNAISMGVTIFGTTLVVLVLFVAMFISFIKSIQESAIHWVASTFLSPSAFVGVFVVIAMLLVSFGSVMLLMPLFGELTEGINTIATDWINENLNLTGAAKQTISTFATVIVMLFAMVFTLKGRKAIMGIAQDYFNNILSKLRMNQTSPSGKQNLALSSLNNMSDDYKGIDSLNDGLEKVMKSPLEGTNNSLKSLGAMTKEKMSDMNDTLQDKAGGAYDSAKEKASEFAGRLKGEETDVDDSDTQGEAISNEIENGIRNMSDQSNSGIEQSNDSQENAIDKAMKSNEELNQAEKDLSDAKENLEALKRSGASDDTIKEAQEELDNAQHNYDNALGRSQDTARDMAESGASIGDIASAQNETAKDFVSATNDINEAEKDLDNLKAQKEQMKNLGASDSELQGVNKEIAQAEDRLENAKSKQGLASEAYDARVGNAQVAKDARNDLLSAQQAQREATRSLKSANENGNLSSTEYNKLRTSSDNLSKDIEYDLNNTQGQIRELESQNGALEFMKTNGGQAFAESDIKAHDAKLQESASNVGALEQKYKEAQKQKNNKTQLSQLSQELNEAKAQQATLQTVMGSIQSGKFSNSAYQAQQQIVNEAYNGKEKAEQAIIDIQKRENSGELIDRSVMQEARSNVQKSNVAYQQATRTLKGLEAQKVAGSNSLSTDKIQTKQAATAQKLEGLQAKYNTLQSGSKVAETLNNGGLINKNQTGELSKAYRIIQEGATNDKNNAITNYEKMAEKVQNLKNQEAKGLPVSAEVNRMQKGLKQAENQMNNAIKHDKFVRTQGHNINKTGQSMMNNVKLAKEKLAETENTLEDRQGKHDNVLKSGGYTHEQLSKYKTNVASDREMYENNKTQLKRQRREKVEQITNDIDKSKKLMGKK